MVTGGSVGDDAAEREEVMADGNGESYGHAMAQNGAGINGNRYWFQRTPLGASPHGCRTETMFMAFAIECVAKVDASVTISLWLCSCSHGM